MTSPTSQDTPVEWATFLRDARPGKQQIVRDAIVLHEQHTPPGVGTAAKSYWFYLLALPDLRLPCGATSCKGDRLFKGALVSVSVTAALMNDGWSLQPLRYTCKNCETATQLYITEVEFKPNAAPAAKLLQQAKATAAPVDFRFGSTPPSRSSPTDLHCIVRKIGEWPVFAPPAPPELVNLIAPERTRFLQGRRAEMLGLGVGAFAYYRRVVESQWSRIIERVIQVAKDEQAEDATITILTNARGDWRFSASVEEIKQAVPKSLFILGANPLLLLHDALSNGLHNEDDEACLAIAEGVRRVLTELAERCALVLKDDNELKDAVKKLTAARRKKSGSDPQ